MGRARKEIPVLRCEQCGNEFEARYYNRRGHSRGPKKGIRFCSKSCAMLARTAGAVGFIDKHGYRMISCGARGKVRPEHHLIMEKIIGRPLRKEETVHHENGVRHDNRPENLELWSGRHCKGARAVDQVAWAKETLAIYGDLPFGPDDVASGMADVLKVLPQYAPRMEAPLTGV